MPHRPVHSRILIWTACLCCAATAAHAEDFATVGISSSWGQLFSGVRSESMGQADLAVGHGPMAIFDNPAPLPEDPSVQVGYGNMEYLSGLDIRQVGVAIELGVFRIGAARMDLCGDAEQIITAFNPEGDADTHKFDTRMMVVAAGMDVAGLLAPRSNWQWTVGLAHRRCRYGGIDEITHANSMDFASSARCRHELDGARVSVSAAGVIHNVKNSDLISHDTRVGLALSFAVDGEHTHDELVMTVACALHDNMDESDFFAYRCLGLEMTVYRMVSFRMGHDTALFGGSNQYGIGIALPDRWIRPFGVAFDWGSRGMGDNLYGGSSSPTMVSATVSYDLGQ